MADMLFSSPRPSLSLWLVTATLLGTTLAAEPQYVAAKIGGKRFRVRDDRQPSLFTTDFGDCLGRSVIDVARFNAAYYKDNNTVLFHLGGHAALTNESIMMSIGVYAYGQTHFSLLFDPCKANIWSACPVEAHTPIEVAGIIPVSPADVSGIPDIALSIPDFEGEAILRIFSNSTQSEIACFAAQITNGNTFSHPVAVGSVLGVVTSIAVLSSFATVVYGDNIRLMRKHYAHSVSVLVVFAVWHHIFYSGALPMNWPSVLVAFRSNYAWAGGMIYSDHMQSTINTFVVSGKRNISRVHGTEIGVADTNPDERYNIDKRRDFPEAFIIPTWGDQDEKKTYDRRFMSTPVKQERMGASNGFKFHGQLVKPGLPLPGNYSGFAGTLAHERIPASSAFLTGFIWFLILITCVASSVVALKLILEGLSRMKLLKHNRLAMFRAHYLGFAAAAVLRTLFIGFFVMMFLTMSQFSYLASPEPVAIACVVFLTMLVGLGGLVGYACFYKLKVGDYVSEPDRLIVQKGKAFGFIPWYFFSRESRSPRSEDKTYVCSMRWWKTWTVLEEKSIHEDEDYTMKFGWLASRFRRTRWWFFVIWLVYEFIRACFHAGTAVKPMVQVLGLMAVEIIAFASMICLRPFEGQRSNVIVVYFLGFSKVSTVALSATFDAQFNLPRIPATVVGVLIIVIHGLLTIVTVIFVFVGAVTSYMSVMRNREEMRPKGWNSIRRKYFEHVDFRLLDLPRPSPIPPKPILERPQEPYFNVRAVKRLAKVEDEDIEFMQEICSDLSTTELLLSRQNTDGVRDPFLQRGRADSVQSQRSYSSLPRGARLHRASWSTHNLAQSYPAGRRRTMSNSMVYTPDGLNCPSSKALPRSDTQFGSLEDPARQPSPLTPDNSQPRTPSSAGR
ncbi:TRP-domain-containing protein [Dothidotthia symphoricarpi CBS 119687]|uniref:TRP-domain-containing protein n=1 Tax=Dothidotthia symphoricarpi CBS 119687 TaxID=1392245 RepID=A0A6A6AH66_9PLEO|nr:TRP-domain-containing protein [Dothidotthia symphoricarpi CBS 119687]KAF2131150.1 TRP-domain-containing protein [Dothidotthia symphoricarpi CBS 119687]